MMLAAGSLSDHRLGRGFGGVVGAVDLDVEDAVPNGVVEFDNRDTIAGHRVCGVVDQNVDGAHFGNGLLDDSSGLGGIAQVGDDGRGAASHGTDFVGHAVDVSPAHRLLVVGEGAGWAPCSGDSNIGAGSC